MLHLGLKSAAKHPGWYKCDAEAGLSLFSLILPENGRMKAGQQKAFYISVGVFRKAGTVTCTKEALMIT